MRTSIAGIIIVLCLSLQGMAASTTLFRDDFDGNMAWDTSDSSVYADNGQLIIDSDGGYGDWAEKTFSIDLTLDEPIVIETRAKLVSGGRGYRLIRQQIVFEDASGLWTTYLGDENTPPGTQGWHLGPWNDEDGMSWTGIHDHAVPGEDHWTVTKIVLTSAEAKLFVKNEGVSEEFFFIDSIEMSHSRIDAILFKQPWDSVNYIDYIQITSIPEPATLGLLALGGMALLRRKRSA